MKFFFTLITCLVSLYSSAVSATDRAAFSKPVRWLAFGDIRGHVESCGCDPATDLGGISRLHYFLTLERQANAPFLLFNLGNNFTTTKVKNSAISSMLKQLPMTASLLNERELLSLPSTLKGVKRLQGEYLLSNAKDYKTKRIQKYVSTDTALVFGYLFNQRVARQVRKFDSKLLEEWQKIFIKHRNKQSYLLYSGSIEHLRVLLSQAAAAEVIFAQVLMSNQAPFATSPTHREKNSPHLLTHQVGTSLVYMTPLAAQGVLRGGEMMHNEAGILFKQKPAADLFGQRITWLGNKYDNQSAEFWQAYLKAKRHEFKQREQEGVKNLSSTKFVGALACKACHVKEYLVWEKSKHARAMQTLTNKNRHLNVDCVVCHSVGFGSGGYVSAKFTSHLAGVQCENCHGAGIEHIKSGGKVKPPFGKEFNCVSCHHPPHTAEFNRQAYWEKIKH